MRAHLFLIMSHGNLDNLLKSARIDYDIQNNGYRLFEDRGMGVQQGEYYLQDIIIVEPSLQCYN